ncbi:MAG: CotH kinase family protein [Bacteroidaceae bacterium]|nr:CotH kinase family protein [Bacteroidaceae bacterium]
MNCNFAKRLFGILFLMVLPLVTVLADEPVFSSSVYYRIITRNGDTRCLDIAGEKSYEGELICLWSNIPTRTTEDWIVKRVGNYYQFLSRNGGWAINDPTVGEVTATTNTGTQLNLAKVDTTSQSQLWDIVPQSDGYFNIINVHTQHTMNLNGGTNADGTQIISYKSDGSNSTSKNRQWRFLAGDSINGNVADSVQVDTTKNDTIIRRLSNLPHIYINTKNGVSITSKKTWVNATLLYIDENDVVTNYDALQIRGRGNSTWNRNPSKKPYRIRFAEAVEFLGPEYANARNWTLMANTYDKTLMRNGLTSELSEFCGMEFNVAHKYVDVTLNGEYIGTYHISDHPEVGEKRVEVPLGTTGTDVSYFLECDGYAEHNYFNTTTKKVPIRIHYPMSLTSAQKTYATNLVNKFESTLFGKDFADPEKGYRALVDSVTLANWYCTIEICGNLDCFWSLYFYRKAGDPKLYIGPCWDYDIAYGNDSRRGDTSQQLMCDVAFELDRAGSWINRMWEDPWFQQLINRRYNEIYDAGVKDFLLAKVDSIATLLNESQALNFKKYGIRTAEYNERVFHNTYGEYVNDLRNYIKAHCDYLKTAFKKKVATGPTPPFVSDQKHYYRIISSRADIAVDLTTQQISEGSLVSMYTKTDSHPTQYWAFVPVDDYYMVLTNDLQYALNDPSPNNTSATSTTVVQLNISKTNDTDPRQLWTIVPQGNGGYYNLINKKSGRTMNLNGGTTTNGTTVISYSTDTEKNKTGQNRLWLIEMTDVAIPQAADVNGDGTVDTQDVLAIYDFILQGKAVGASTPEDVNRDGLVDTQDVLCVYDYIIKH